MAELPLSGRHILVAEDEYMIAMDLRRDLRAEGAVVIGPAPSVEKALDIIEGEPRVDAALLDINLAGEPVFPLADLLRERGVPLLFATGYDMDAIPKKFADVPCCVKPLNIDDVLAALKKVVSGD